MPDIARIEELEEYPSKYADYQIALRDAGEDETSKLKAQLAWSNTQRELERSMTQRNELNRSLEQARARVKEQYATVPEHIYAAAATAEEMEQRAKDFADAVAAQVAAQNPNPAPNPGSTGQPPTGLPTQPQTGNDLESRLRDLAPKVQRRAFEPGANDEFQNLMINGVIAPAMMNAKRAAGGTR